MARICVTGGAGFIGSILVPALLDAGHKVVVLDSFRWNQSSLAHVCADPGLEIVRGDARDERVLAPLLRKADIIIPLAALVGAPLCDADQEGAISTNLGAIETLCRLALREQPIILPNTNSGYGNGDWCTEESPLQPISLYGRSKVDAERVVMDRGNAVAFRLATVFGASPRMRLDLLLNEFVWKALIERSIVLFEQNYMRNFAHVRDVASAFVHAIDNFGTMRDQVFNVGDSRANTSKLQLCERIKVYLPEFHFTEASIMSDPDKRNYLVSNEKIERAGWKPRYSIDDGIQELIKLYRGFARYTLGNV